MMLSDARGDLGGAPHAALYALLVEPRSTCAPLSARSAGCASPPPFRKDRAVSAPATARGTAAPISARGTAPNSARGIGLAPDRHASRELH